jgi:predicted Zn-dependent protease
MKIRNLAAISLLVFGTLAANDVAPSNSELEAMYDRAYRAFDSANYVQALKELDAIDARKPDLAASQNLRGVIYMRQGIYDKAEAALSEANNLDPKFWNARYNLAEIPFQKKDWSEARKRFQDLLTTNSADLQGEATQLIQYKILLTYLLEGNDTMVDSILAKFELSPDTPAVHYANAAISLQNQNIPDAKKWMTAAEKNFSTQLNKLFAESLYEIGWLQKQPGQQRPAVQLLSPEERTSKARALAKTQFEQALQAYEQHNFESASKLAAEADKTDPNQPQILNLRGEILLEQQKYDEAETFFKDTLKADPKFREAQFNLADVPFRNKDYATARDRFQGLLKQTPGGDKNHAAQLINFKIFLTYLLEGKDSRAQKLMEQFQFSGDTPSLYYAQAAWEFQHNNAEKANDWITSARKIYPLASNDLYAAGFYDLGWLKSAAAISSPAPSAAAVASTQTESSGPAIEPSPIPGAEVKAEEGTQLAMAQTPRPSPAAKASEALVNAMPAEVIVSNAQTTGSSAQPGDLPAAPAAAGISVEPATPNATPAPALALATPTATPAPVLATPAPEASAAAASSEASTPQAAPATPNITPAPALALATPATTPVPVLATPAPEVSVVAASSEASTPEVAPATPAPELAVAAQPATPAGTTAGSATPATALAPEKVAQFTPSPSFSERISSFTGQRPLVFWLFILGAAASGGAWLVMEARRLISRTLIGHRPATVTGPSLHDDHAIEEETPQVQTQKRFVGGPRQISVELKPSEPVLRRTVIPVAKRVVEPVAAPPVEPETLAAGGRIVEPSYIDSEESSVGPAIEQVPTNGKTEVAPDFPLAPPIFVEQVSEPVVAEPESEPEGEPVAAMAVAEEALQAEPIETVSQPTETVSEPTEAVSEPTEAVSGQIEVVSEPIEAVSEPIEAEASVLEAEPYVPAIAKLPAPTEIEGQDEEWSREPEPVEQGPPVPYQTVVTAEEPADIASLGEPEVATVAEIAGVSDTIAGISMLPELPETQAPTDVEDLASQPTTIETMPETLQTPTAPVIRTSGGPTTQPVHTASAPQAAAGGMHTAVQITLSCEIASMQLTPTFKMGALQLRPISKIVTMRLASSPQQQPAMNLQANFEISKIQAAQGGLGQMRVIPSQQQKPATLASSSLNISGLQVVSGFETAPLQLTPSHQTQASVHLTAAFQITSVEFSPTLEIAAMLLNSTSKTVAVQLPGAGATSAENAPTFEITNVQMANNGEIAMLQLNPVGAKRG